MTASSTQSAPLRSEPLGRLWQQAWLDDVAAGGPLVFADWLAGLPDGLDSPASWRIDLLVADHVSRSGAGQVVVEPEPGGRCLSAGSVLLVETVLADLGARDIAVEESVSLLGPAVAVLADSETWPVPPGLRDRLESLAAMLTEALVATGAEVREADRLLGVPADGADATATDVLDLERAVAACLAVPRAVLATAAVEGQRDE
jgi:hypothetical protein